MSENEPPQLGVDRIVMPWCDIVQEEILRIHGGSFTVAWGWSIAWSGTGWQVFFQGVCADELTMEHETFRAAYESIEVTAVHYEFE